MPEPAELGLPENDPDADVDAGVGDRPPRIDDPETAARLVSWIRLRPARTAPRLALAWAGVNAVEVEQRRSLRNLSLGVSDGSADQRFQLPAGSVDPASLVLAVQRGDGAFEQWRRIEDLHFAGRDDSAFQLDAEAGVIGFGDGVRGRVPQAGARVRVIEMRHGGGRAGNLAAGTLAAISQPRLSALQPLATRGGAEAETLDEAEKRLPSRLRHQDRAVTETDYADLARGTPGVDIARVQVMPRFRPFQRLSDVPGVVTVQVVPAPAVLKAPHPRASRSLIQAVHDRLDARRMVGTEMYVVGIDYVPVAVSVSVGLVAGHATDTVTRSVEEALRLSLFPAAPGGRDGAGWPFGRAPSNLELEVAAARTEGVRAVFGLNLFLRGSDGSWQVAPSAPGHPAQAVALERWQLPELRDVLVVTDATEAPGSPLPPGTGSGGSGSGSAQPIPVVPELC
nr:putative baseplate assembly protein [Mangrovicoccus sp. HB161399]